MEGTFSQLIRLATASSVFLALVGCNGASAPTSPSPVSVATAALPVSAQSLVPPSIAFLDGTVMARAGAFYTTLDWYPLRGALVEVFEDGVVTATAISDDAGNFHFELPARPVRLRASTAAYGSGIGPEVQLQAGVRTITSVYVNQKLVRPAPTVLVFRDITGVVTSALGTPVEGAAVYVSDVVTHYSFGGGSTDAAGRFRFRFQELAQPGTSELAVWKSGFPTIRIPFPCCADPEPVVINVAMPLRVTKVILNGPATLRVMVPEQYTADVVFEDGSQVTMTPNLFETVGVFQNSQSGPGMIEARQPGGGWISWTYQNMAAGVSPVAVP